MHVGRAQCSFDACFCSSVGQLYFSIQTYKLQSGTLIVCHRIPFKFSFTQILFESMSVSVFFSLHCSDDTIRFHKSFRHILLHTICVHRVKCQKGIRSVCLDCVNVLDVCSSWHQVIFLIWPLPSSPALISATGKKKNIFTLGAKKM